MILLGSKRASRGWILAGGYALAIVLVLAAATWGAVRLSIPDSPIVTYGELFAGVALIILGSVRAFRIRRRGPSRTRSVFGRLEAVRPWEVGLVGAQFAFHPETLVLTFAAGTRILAADLDVAQSAVLIVVFSVVSVSTVIVPSILYATAGHRARRALEVTRDWLTRNADTITAVLVVLFGVILVFIGTANALKGAG